MAGKFLSPYSPRRRRSARLVVIWVSLFLFILWMTRRISTRQPETAKPYVDDFVRPGRMVKDRGVGEEQ
ncbi:hypothetical protein C8A00DRAFT_29644 [Chaetomidium leptoderma]|uniref:Uncharacterized protein n=1 Tax=Chaetomidium leptoderma TaxID=669021 RepID=A0AAN6VU61_9PEZI|nr:hypothetical protein C8A00DRAFT_29644 [Chaetomidium leptoderma]